MHHAFLMFNKLNFLVMKKNKKNEAIASQVENNITAKAEVTNQTAETATVTTKEKKNKKEKKAKKAKAEASAQVIETPTAKKTKKKAKVVKEVAAQQKESILEEVVSKRGVKYIYPEDVQDTLSRKTWRQKTRNELHRLELAVSRIKDTNSKEYKKALKAYEDFKATVLKPEQVA